MAKLVGTLDALQKALKNPNSNQITINSTILINEDTVIDLNGKTVNIVANFFGDSVFKFNNSNISLTFKSSSDSGGIVPIRLNKDYALVSNAGSNNTVTFDTGFDVDYSRFKNFDVIKSSKAITLNFSGANLTYAKQIRSSFVNVSGGSLTCTDDAALVITSNGKLNITGGTVKTTAQNKVSITLNSEVKANISGGTTGCIRLNDDGSSLTISDNAQIIDSSAGIYVPEESTNVLIEMTGGTITSENNCGIYCVASDSGSKINITGGTIKAAENGVYSFSLLNVSGGTFISEGDRNAAIFGCGVNSKISITGGTFINKVGSCVSLKDGAEVIITGGIFEGGRAIFIDDSKSKVLDEVHGATFNTKYDYTLWDNAFVKIHGVTYKQPGEDVAWLKQKFTDLNQLDSVFVDNGSVEVTDNSGTITLKKGDEYEYINKSFDKMITYWQAHLYKNYGLSYRAEILSSLYFGLQTDKLIMLVGSPGTGKTTLVKYLAKTFGFEDAAIIPVQPNWTDKSDLLGYFNPLEKSYIATDFLESLIKFCKLAKTRQDEFFIICLDEMNLAHIEYYFAEFLSALQTDRKITLYDESTEKNIRRELEINNFEPDANSIADIDDIATRKYHLELWKMFDTVNNFPAVIEIPPNVKFFGTLNQDETTLDISPKVIDRSYIIRLDRCNEDLNFDGDFTNTLEYQPLTNYRQKFSADIDVKNFQTAMEGIAPISYRLTAQILANENFETWQKIIGANELADFIISACFLPKIRFDEDVYKEKISALKNLCDGHQLSSEILSAIDTGKEIVYWRR